MYSAQIKPPSTSGGGSSTIVNPSTSTIVNLPTPTAGAHGRRWLTTRKSDAKGITPTAVHAPSASKSFMRDILARLPSLRWTRGPNVDPAASPDFNLLPAVVLQAATPSLDPLLEAQWTDETYDFLVNIDTDDITSASACGGGGFGTVYCVKHRSAGKVALKKLHGNRSQESVDEQIRRILREGETWLSLDHPGILRIYGVIESCHDLYLVTPHLQNGSLRDYLESHPDADRLRLIQEIAAALAYLHTLGLIHGDVSAGNVLVSDDVHAVLCDFGLARPITEATSVGLKGSGNPRWQSPELWVPEASKTEKSDVWAFAMTAYEVLSSKLPFHNYTKWAVVAAVAQRDERPLKGPTHSQSGQTYAAAWDVVSDCWHKLPDQRPTMMVAYRRLLAADPVRIDLLSTIDIDGIQAGRRVGGGGFGEVYLVQHPTAGPLALKRMITSKSYRKADENRRRTLREAEVWEKLDHPNVLRFLGILESEGQMFLVSPFLKNGSIVEYIRRTPNADRPRLVCETAGGIAYLHEKYIIHGDIKGSNVLVSDECHAQICDFGLTKATDQATSVGLAGVGSIRWMSPELLEAGEGKTFKSDVWAFGMTILEVLSGRVPFHEHAQSAAVIWAIVQHRMPRMEPLESPSGVSYAVLWRLVAGILQRDPSKRPSMREAHHRLGATQPGPSPSFQSSRRAPNPPSLSAAPPSEPFIPGWYRAIHAFEAQGAEEMSLEVGQLYQCDERSGNPNDGWVSAAHMVRKVVNEGLVPEAYLELVQPM